MMKSKMNKKTESSSSSNEKKKVKSKKKVEESTSSEEEKPKTKKKVKSKKKVEESTSSEEEKPKTKKKVKGKKKVEESTSSEEEKSKTKKKVKGKKKVEVLSSNEEEKPKTKKKVKGKKKVEVLSSNEEEKPKTKKKVKGKKKVEESTSSEEEKTKKKVKSKKKVEESTSSEEEKTKKKVKGKKKVEVLSSSEEEKPKTKKKVKSISIKKKINSKKKVESSSSPKKLVKNKKIVKKEESTSSPEVTIKMHPKKKVDLPEIKDNLQKLNKHILEIIVNFLPVKERANLNSTSVLFNTYLNVFPIDLSGIEMGIDDFKEYFGNKPKANITGLYLRIRKTEEMKILEPFLPRLKILKFENWYDQTSDKSINIKSLSKAVKLEILSMPLMVTSLSVVSELPLLASLTIAFLQNENSLEWLPKCHNLIELTIHGLITRSKCLAPDFPMPTLRKLSLLYITILNIEEDIDLNKFPNLEELSIIGSKIVKEISFITQAKKLKVCILNNIEIIEIDGNIDFTIFQQFLQLEVLYLNLRPNGSISPIIDTNIFSVLTHLREVTFHDCYFTRDSTLENFTHLRKLDLGYIKGDLQIPPLPRVIPDESGITSLTLQTNEKYIINVRGFSLLKEVDLSKCLLLEDIGFLLSCKNLTKVTLSYRSVKRYSDITEDLERIGLKISTMSDDFGVIFTR
jgi:hypothetical protein